MQKPCLDVFKILENTDKFSNYPKNKTGILSFINKELKLHPKYDKERRCIVIDNSLYSLQDFANIILRPLYHCSWDKEVLSIINQKNYSVIETWFMNSISIDMIPEDWRDLTKELIENGKIKLENYQSVKELEKEVDNLLFEDDNNSSIEENKIICIEDEPLNYEEKEIIAKTFQLDINSFRTKREATSLYEQKMSNKYN